MLFPNKEHRKDVSDYDTIITCSNFATDLVKIYCGRKAITIHPYIDSSVFRPPEKRLKEHRKRILSVGRFLKEESGHSKSQDKVISLMPYLSEDYSLTLAGSCLSIQDRIFLEECKEYARQLGVKVDIKENITYEQLANLYRSHRRGHSRRQ